jgi:hypothetical protein
MPCCRCRCSAGKAGCHHASMLRLLADCMALTCAMDAAPSGCCRSIHSNTSCRLRMPSSDLISSSASPAGMGGIWCQDMPSEVQQLCLCYMESMGITWLRLHSMTMTCTYQAPIMRSGPVASQARSQLCLYTPHAALACAAAAHANDSRAYAAAAALAE